MVFFNGRRLEHYEKCCARRLKFTVNMEVKIGSNRVQTVFVTSRNVCQVQAEAVGACVLLDRSKMIKFVESALQRDENRARKVIQK